LIAAIGLHGAYGDDLATFGASMLAIWLLPSTPPMPDAERPSLRSIAEGFRYISVRPVLLGIFVADTNAMIFGMPEALFPAFGAHLGGGAETVGFLYAAPWIGAFGASVVSISARRSPGSPARSPGSRYRSSSSTSRIRLSRSACSTCRH
jgi:hypothetical protein